MDGWTSVDTRMFGSGTRHHHDCWLTPHLQRKFAKKVILIVCSYPDLFHAESVDVEVGGGLDYE